MSRTILNNRNLIPITNPTFEPSSEENGWNVVYRPERTFKVSECYLEEVERNMLLIQLNTTLLTPNVNLANHTENIRSLFSKFKDFEVSNVEFCISIGNRTVANPMITEYDNRNPTYQMINGTGDITFNFLSRNVNSGIFTPKQITIRSIPLQGYVKKENDEYFWDIDIESKIIYLQLVFLRNSYQNMEGRFLEFTNLQREKYLDLCQYLDKHILSVDNTISLHMNIPNV